MKKKNLSAKKKIHNFYIYKQKNPKIRKIYYEFKKNVNFFYYIVDHKLRIESTKEAKLTKRELKKFGINCKILILISKFLSKNFSFFASLEDSFLNL